MGKRRDKKILGKKKRNVYNILRKGKVDKILVNCWIEVHISE